MSDRPQAAGPLSDKFPKMAGTREQEIERGRQRGEQEAASRGETGVTAKQRVAQAMAYAAFCWDGRPHDSHASYAAEFGLADVEVLLSTLRPDPERAA